MFTRVLVLAWADILAGYAMWMLMIYLTDIWKLYITHAAAIINVFMGTISIMPLAMQFIVFSLAGNCSVLLVSSFAYCMGMGLLTMSIPPVLAKAVNTCSGYEPECIGYTQRTLFYIALCLISVGTPGHITALGNFIQEQVIDALENVDANSIFTMFTGNVATVVFLFIAVVALPCVKSWALQFGIPALFMLVGTLFLFSGSSVYLNVRPQGSHLMMVVASASKLFQWLPVVADELHEMSVFCHCSIPRIRGLKF